MKQFKQFFVFALISLFSVSMWGADVTYQFKDDTSNPGNAVEWTSGTIDAYTGWSTTKGTNPTAYYNTGTGLRVYNGGSFTITSSKTLASVTLTFSGTGYTFSSSNTDNPQTVEPDETSYEWSVGRTCRLQKIEITYASGGDIIVKTLKSIAVAGMTTSYDQGDAFSFDGTCTATYSVTKNSVPQPDENKAVTPTSVSSPDMATTGNKTITVSYTENEVTKTTTYDITVNAASGDKLTRATTGITGSSYGDWADVAGASGAVYAGNSAGGNDAIQLRKSSGTQDKSGIITTTSGGYIRTVKVTWNSNTADSRTINIYGKNTAFASVDELYDNETAGTLLGTIVNGTSTQLAIGDDYEYVGVVSNSGALYLDKIVFEWEEKITPSVEKPVISGNESFLTSTDVTLTCATAGATIYYTTDGTDPKTSSTKQSGTAFTLTNTATVRAIANLGSDWSAEATSKTFTKVTPMTTAAELRSFATSSAQNAFIQLDGWKVTFVNGNNAYMIDPSNEGVILNNASHGYVAGDELNDEVVEASVKLASGRVQLSGFTSTNITATSGTATAAEIADFSTLTLAHQSRLVTLKDATYASSTSTFSDGVNSIYYYDQFSANPTLVDGATYDVTGIVIYYKSGTTEKVQIAPREATDVVSKGSVVIPTAANLAALKAADRGTYILTLTNAVVTYVNGNNAFIEDATGGALIYIASHGFTAGNCLNGDYQVTTTDHQGKFEITAIEPQAGAATTTAEIPLTTISIATLNASFASYESRRIKIVGANVTDAISGSDRNGTINDGAELAVYAAVASTITLTASDNVDIIGYPGFHNTDQQLTVWQQSDITVNEKDPAGIAFTPESETITGGDPWSAPAFANPNSLDVDFGTSNDAVATVSNTGVVSLVGGYGTAIITAHTDGDATHASATVTYTITVNDPGATPVYTMSFDLTRASYDDAADEEVVWNSNVVTITAQKGSGTKVTNYLAGNYSSGTLIAETRLYENNNLVFTPKAGVTITKVEWHATAKAYAESLAKEGTTTAWTNATAALDGTDNKLVIITPSAAGEFSAVLGKSGSNKGTRALNVVVYYQAESEKAKLPASISIDDMNMAVGDDDILLSAIAATSNPNKKAISYAVTSGTAVTIEGTGAEAALHAVAEGSATITATIPNDLGNYTGATKNFTVTVSAAATLESIAISGEATELEYTEGQSFNPAGLTVMGHYSNGSDEEITSGIDWTFAPDPLTEGTTSVSVTATVETISSDAIVVNGLTVSGPAPVGDNYVKVTASQADWSGDYLLVYEDGENAYVWNGDYSDGANNYASATISSNTIAKPAAAAVITIAAASEGKYTLQVNGDKYFQDNGSNAKLIFTDAIADAAEVTISYETDWTKLLFSERCIRFNKTSGQTRFRFYAAENQQAVQLYKKEAPTPDYTRDDSWMAPGELGTICIEHGATAIGGDIFELVGKNAEGKIVFATVDEMEPGKPYLFEAKSNRIDFYYTPAAAATEPDNSGAMKGSFTDYTLNNVENVYYFSGHALWRVSGDHLNVVAHRAYVKLDEVHELSSAAPAPGRRYITMNVHGQNQTTGIEDLLSGDAPKKVLIEGTLYILRGEKMYNANGQLVK
ncbi:MAG: chitobiase/beta-hexosaminidase C-terminal domain-containing protein [Paludibacteraceae bacterium]|nr:chitobiase/beta-hexosaminidase C-terminal domain-containing protein [Paludibacteraceae bacterium]